MLDALTKLQHGFAADLWNNELNQLDGVILDGVLPAERLFQVYRNNFWISVRDVLSDIYNVVERLVGKQFFDFMTDRFLRHHPPRQGNLHQLGSELPIFLSNFKSVSELPYLSDIARLEWAYHQVFHAADSRRFNPQALLGLPPNKISQLHFVLQTGSQLLCSSYPIFKIWKRNQEGNEGSQPIKLSEGGESVLVTRPQLEVELHNLDPVDAGFLQYLIAGHNLAQAAESAFRQSSDFDLQATLRRFFVSDVLVLRPLGHSIKHFQKLPTN